MSSDNAEQSRKDLYSKIGNNPAVAVIGVSLFLAVIILIWGYFRGLSLVEKPESRTGVFPKEAYQEASDFFSSARTFSYLGGAVLREEAMTILKGEIHSDPIESLVDAINRKYIGKSVVVPGATADFSNREYDEAYAAVVSGLNDEIIKREEAIDRMVFWEREDALASLRAKRILLRRIDSLYLFIKNGQLNFKIAFPNGRTSDSFGFIATDRFEGIIKNAKDSCIFTGQNARPAFTTTFLKMAGVPATDIDETKLKRDKDLLKSITEEARAAYQAELKQMGRALSEARAQARKRFYNKWFPVLIRALVTFFMCWVLILYFKVIRRKGLPRKSTFEAYFATNMTSVILRWIALGVVVIGMAGLVIGAVRAVISANISISSAMDFRAIQKLLPLFLSDSGYLGSIVGPVTQTIGTVVSAWVFLLFAEFICFLSNCYHVLFLRAYEKDQAEKEPET